MAQEGFGMRIQLVLIIIVILIAQRQPLGAQSTTAPAQSEQERASIERWTQLIKSGKQQQVIDECTTALNSSIDASQKTEIHFVRALAGISMKRPEAKSFVEAFIASAPHDERGGELLFRLAKAQGDQADQNGFYSRADQQYPGTYWATMAQGALHQADGMGMPFNLDFTDAITGKPVSVQNDFRGKVIVIDFWATWCSDCAAELPHMLAIYSKYKNQGVEFVGVSLDESESLGGLTKLRDYVKAKGMTWPEYYQGDKFDSPFSSTWGVSSTPTVFILDKRGRLYSTSADGKLDELIPLLLAQPMR
jgi:thiol-disulfide isomerase/thioredoxin